MNLEKAREALRKHFGYNDFRPLQAEIIQHAYDKKDALVLMPTGGGKSICFQIPAITLPGTCVVVSPLISLMKDQVDGLVENGVKAAFLNSSMDNKSQAQVENAFFRQQLDLLYVSPEKLISAGFFPLLRRAALNLFAIDEAHCISAWGHDFRPEYTQLQFIKRTFPEVPVMALTATADRVTREDIINQLQLSSPRQFVASFDRPNLSIEVKPGQKRLEQIQAFIKTRPNQPGIIYCLSRKNTEELALKLQAKGVRAMCYHAGMADAARAKVQEAFINDKTLVICATIAFGMGIDKSNVRWIIHYNLPKNLESYYQEIGRAGRDGAPADTLLFYSYQDVSVLQDIINGNESENREIQLSKLERMRQYAETLVCRRRILLNYFGEEYTKSCGHCDVCRNPPQQFDGTVLAQKALSAIARLKEQVGMNMLIDVLRGSGRKEIFDNQYHTIKTYGAGRNLSFRDWQAYILQLINMGYIEVATDQYNVLKLTNISQEVLFEGKQVPLVKIVTLNEKKAQEKEKETLQRQKVPVELFEMLRKARLQLAQKKGVPPYLIFSDVTLNDMASLQPMNEAEMMQVSGVGEFKLQEYGKTFIEVILSYKGSKDNVDGANTYMITLEMFESGLSVEEIAFKRKLNVAAVFNHFTHLLERGTTIDINALIPGYEQKEAFGKIAHLPAPRQFEDLVEALGDEIPHYKLKLMWTYARQAGAK